MTKRSEEKRLATVAQHAVAEAVPFVVEDDPPHLLDGEEHGLVDGLGPEANAVIAAAMAARRRGLSREDVDFLVEVGWNSGHPLRRSSDREDV